MAGEEGLDSASKVGYGFGCNQIVVLPSFSLSPVCDGSGSEKHVWWSRVSGADGAIGPFPFQDVDGAVKDAMVCLKDSTELERLLVVMCYNKCAFWCALTNSG
jgi:hypothetical protein